MCLGELLEEGAKDRELGSEGGRMGIAQGGPVRCILRRSYA